MQSMRFGLVSFALISVVLGLRVASGAPRAADFDPSAYTPIDTSNLLGSPDPLPPLVVEPAFPNLKFSRPVVLTHAGDDSGRLFVCDQPGIVYVFENRDDVGEAKVFLDIRDKTLTQHFEEGLLGLAFHPRYRENGEFFVYYSTPPRASIVARYRVSESDPNRADPESEERLLEVEQPFGNHNGGSIEFGPDGMLYVALGDGGRRDDPFGNGQNLETLLGSILRIDVEHKQAGKNYAVPRDNPFVGRGENVRGEIWAYGIRNPWRMTFDSKTGDLWVADVGQDLWEEVNVIVKGGNYGWSAREGHHPLVPRRQPVKPNRPSEDPMTEAIHVYPRHEGKSITGGHVYRGQSLPAFAGAYFYSDFVNFNIWALTYDGSKVTSNQRVARSPSPVTSFGIDDKGEILFTTFEAAEPGEMDRLSMGDYFRLTRGGVYRLRRRSTPTTVAAPFPRRLSETGLFTNVEELLPARGLVPYSVNVPLWSDGADKERYVAMPAGAKIDFSADGHWKFPLGTVLVKTFTLENTPGRPARRLETRLLVKAGHGWNGYTYVWNHGQTDADLLDGAAAREVAKPGQADGRMSWYFPSRSDCNACHTKTAGFALGLNTRQMNRVHDYGDVSANQLAMFDALGLFSQRLAKYPHDFDAYPEWGSRTADTASLARAYLDVNCALCHAPGGTGVAKADFRFHTPLAKAGVLNETPGQLRLGAVDSAVVVPGAPQRSELLLRLMVRGPGRMPTLATSEIDWEAVRVLGEWISGLTPTATNE